MKKNKILIAPNSFKECSDSVTIAGLITQNLSGLKNIELITKPMSDGGDGFLNVCKFYFSGEILKFEISTPYDESKIECPILYIESRKVIYIESAEVLGLKIIPPFHRNPMRLSSKGLGELLSKMEEYVKDRKIIVEKVYIGIGGTATIDMGIGMMSKLGLGLLDSNGKELNVIPDQFQFVQSAFSKPTKLSFEIIPVVDVTNPLLGSQGGIQTYGRQKGADEKAISVLEKSFIHLLNLLKNLNLDVSSNTLSGAGGGIPAAFKIFFKSEIIPSTEFIKHDLGFEKYLKSVDYLITGEGAYDYQSNLGKGAGVLIEMFSQHIKVIFLVCGRISKSNILSLPKNVIPIELSGYFENQQNSIINYQEGLKKACQEIIYELNF